MKRMKRNPLTAKYASHSGQSMLEVAVALPFLLLIVIALIEMGIVFASYVALVNAAREGAIFAAMCPVIADSSKDTDSNLGSSCTPPIQNIQEYQTRVKNEIVTVLGGRLVAGQIQIEDSTCNSGDPFWGYVDCLQVDRPVLSSNCQSCVCPPPGCSSCPTGKETGCPITVTVHYRLYTFTSGMSLPVPRVKSSVPAMPAFGAPSSQWTNWFFSIMGSVDWSTGWRMGLPNYYQLDYSVGMPIR